MVRQSYHTVEFFHGSLVIFAVLKLPLPHRHVKVGSQLTFQVVSEHMDIVAEAEVSVKALELPAGLFDLAKAPFHHWQLRCYLFYHIVFFDQSVQFGSCFTTHLVSHLFLLRIAVFMCLICRFQNFNLLLLLTNDELDMIIVYLLIRCV